MNSLKWLAGAVLNLVFALCTIVAALLATPALATPTDVRIDAGAAVGHVDIHGNSWLADENFVGGAVVDRGAIPIANTDDPVLCRTERYGMSAYNVPVPNGRWRVRLHFCETYFTQSGQRIFDVNVAG